MDEFEREDASLPVDKEKYLLTRAPEPPTSGFD